MKLSRLLIVFIVCVCICSYGQTFENIRPTISGDKVIITYDLKYPDPTQKFNVSLYGSHDKYTNPITPVEGNIGQNVTPGKGLRIVWDAKNSTVSLDSEIIFRLKGTLKLALKPLGTTAYKKGQDVKLDWVGSGASDRMNIELIRNGKVYKTLAEKTPNTFSYNWKIPKNLKAGKDYSIRLTNANLPNEVSASELIIIKPKIPLLIKGLVVAGVVGVVIWQPWKGEEDNNLPGLTIKPN
jgi:Ser-Thr-rich glycosyl-phosphatidyl-inositol-anchored membrane family